MDLRCVLSPLLNCNVVGEKKEKKEKRKKETYLGLETHTCLEPLPSPPSPALSFTL